MIVTQLRASIKDPIENVPFCEAFEKALRDEVAGATAKSTQNGTPINSAQLHVFDLQKKLTGKDVAIEAAIQVLYKKLVPPIRSSGQN